jgi:UDP-2,4-diacetamido-2,4,6-trideoxy-beta-L-altropyranose hydrolase
MGIYRGERVIFIRADSNYEIASGHIMRCTAIAKNIKNIGEEVTFLIADENPISMLEDAQMSYKVLGTDWHDLMSDCEIVAHILQSEHDPVLLIDTYRITREYVERLAPFCRIAYLGSKKEYLGPLNVIVNYSTDIDYSFYDKSYGNSTKLLLGPSYAPLREEFQNIAHNYKDHVQRILVTTGNTDPQNIVGDIIKNLLSILSDRNIILEIVVGRMFYNKEKIYELCQSNKLVHLNENVKDMSLLMRQCDLAVSANGTTVYELAAMGIPIISFAMVEEQVKSAETLNRLGVLCYCGNATVNQDLVCERILEKVSYYINNNVELRNLADKAKELIDGNGCKKIVQELIIR